MIDHLAAHLALRNRALSLSVATTGSTSLSATATGYERASGSFVTDGFVVGMEFSPTGFAVNAVHVIASVSAIAITTPDTIAVEVAASGRTLAVGLPALRAYENVNFDPTASRWYFEEDYVPGTSTLYSGPAAGGEVEETGLYVVKLYAPSGTDVAALRKSVDALKLLFAPGTKLTAGSHFVRVRGDTAPQTGQIIRVTGGWSVLVLTIPWRAYSLNAIAA